MGCDEEFLTGLPGLVGLPGLRKTCGDLRSIGGNVFEAWPHSLTPPTFNLNLIDETTQSTLAK